MDLEGIMLSETSQGEVNTVWYHFYVGSEKQTRQNNNNNKQTHTENKLVVTSREREG